MPKFRKKPVVIEAHQWYRNGDHPLDYVDKLDFREDPPGYFSERLYTAAFQRMHDWGGSVVRRYRRPDDSGQRRCEKCHHTMHDHGWIDTLEGGHNVCPGDWIITGVKGEYYPCKPDIFEMTYEPA